MTNPGPGRRPRGMRRIAAGALIVAALSVESQAQNTSPSQPPDPPPPMAEAPEGPRVYRTTGSRVAIGRSIRIDVDEEVIDAVVVIGGSLRVDGRVRDGLVVVGGDVDLGPQADVRGDVVVVGGTLNRAPGARLRGSVSDVTFGEWRRWVLGSFWIPVVDFGDFGRWLTLMGTTFRISLLALMAAIFLVIARQPVARIGRAAAAEPVRAFVVGLLAEVLFVPLLVVASIALILTVIGIPLVIFLLPLTLLLAAIAMMLGFTALACRIGEWLEDRLGIRAHSAFIATALGLLLVVGPTMLARIFGVTPWMAGTGFALLLIATALEFIIWTTGLGATLMTGFGRWSTVPPPMPAPPVPLPQNA